MSKEATKVTVVDFLGQNTQNQRRRAPKHVLLSVLIELPLFCWLLPVMPLQTELAVGVVLLHVLAEGLLSSQLVL